jgi:23S rRNA pseudouridine955/2504/2580 synthase
MSDRERHGRVEVRTIGEEAEDQRIDNYLLKQLKGVPRSRIYRMLRRGEVRVNGGRVKATCRLHSGDKVRIPPLRVAAAAPPQRLTHEQGQRLAALTIYEDERLRVIERLRLMQPQQRELELVHRLDRETSGLLMIAKRRSALRRLHELQRQGAIKKSYLALVYGDWPRNRMDVKAPLKTNQVQGGERIVRPHPQGKEALTAFRIKEQFSEAMLVEAVLGTGRTHQIRVHAQYLGTPILGDSKYADEPTRQLARQLGLKRLFLHAEKLSFPWGENAELLQLQAPLEQPLVAILERLRER